MFTYRHAYTINNKNAVRNLWKRKNKSCTYLTKNMPIIGLVSRRWLSVFMSRLTSYIRSKHMAYATVDSINDTGKLTKQEEIGSNLYVLIIGKVNIRNTICL